MLLKHFSRREKQTIFAVGLSLCYKYQLSRTFKCGRSRDCYSNFLLISANSQPYVDPFLELTRVGVSHSNILVSIHKKYREFFFWVISSAYYYVVKIGLPIF